MKKIIYRFLLFTLLLIFGFITYLSTIGIKTDAFNHQISKEIKKLQYEQRLEIVEMMLKVIYSDSQLCEFEDRLVRKVAGLIYIENKDLGEIKLKIKK